MSKRRSHIATTEKCCHCVLGGEAKQGALSESYLLCVFPLSYQARLKKIDGLRYRFPHTSAVNYSLAVFFSHIHSFLIFASALAFFSCRFCSLTLFVSFCSIFHTCAATLYQALHIRKRGKKALSDPLCFHFPRFLGRTDSIAACW